MNIKKRPSVFTKHVKSFMNIYDYDYIFACHKTRRCMKLCHCSKMQNDGLMHREDILKTKCVLNHQH